MLKLVLSVMFVLVSVTAFAGSKATGSSSGDSSQSAAQSSDQYAEQTPTQVTAPVTIDGVHYFPLHDPKDKNKFIGCFGYDDGGTFYEAKFQGRDCSGKLQKSTAKKGSDVNQELNGTVRSTDPNDLNAGKKYRYTGLTHLKFANNGKDYFARLTPNGVEIVPEGHWEIGHFRDQGNNEPISHAIGNTNPAIHPLRQIETPFVISAKSKQQPAVPPAPPAEPKQDPRQNPGVIVGGGSKGGPKDVPDVEPQTPPSPPAPAPVPAEPKKLPDVPGEGSSTGDKPTVSCELKKSVNATGDKAYCDVIEGDNCHRRLLKNSCRVTCQPGVCQSEIDKVDGKVQEAMKKVQEALENFRQALNDNSNDTTCLTIKSKLANKKVSDLEIYRQYMQARGVDGQYKKLVGECHGNYEQDHQPARSKAAGGKPSPYVKRRTQSADEPVVDPSAKVPEEGDPNQPVE